MRKERLTLVLEASALIIYIVSISITIAYHEPWFDEAQAWLIARDNNIFDILWNILRYEGHTPLWYIILYIPAHMGVTFEFGLKLTSVVFISLAAFILVKKSPFPLIIRLLLPFTYFLFYQYGVISRSYSMLSAILWIVAATFPSRNQKPLKFSLLLALLGGVTVHGMLIAFGIAAAWFVEIVSEHRTIRRSFSANVSLIVKDRRFHTLLLLAFFNIVYAAILWPMPDKFTPLQSNKIDPGFLLFKLFIAPLNAVVSDVWPGISGHSSDMLPLLLFIGIILTAVFFIWALYRGVFLYVVLPYVFTALFMSFIYFSMNHTGIYTLMIIFGLWLSLGGGRPFSTPEWIHKASMFFSNKTIRTIITACTAYILLLQAYWSASASVNDIKMPYAAAGNLASFIQDNGIEGRKIFNCYNISNDKLSYSMQDAAILAYFPKNIFYNHNEGKENVSYVTHHLWKDEDAITYLKDTGAPEFVIEHKSPISFYSSVLTPRDYIPVASFQSYNMWKNRTSFRESRLYIRKDLLPQFPNLMPVEDNMPGG